LAAQKAAFCNGQAPKNGKNEAMRMRFPLLVGLGLAFLTPLHAQNRLPTYADFQKADAERRKTGTLVSADLLRLTRVDTALLTEAVQKSPDDADVLWSAASLTNDSAKKREWYSRAAKLRKHQAAISLRWGAELLAGRQRADAAEGVALVQVAAANDPNNLAPLAVQIWYFAQQNDTNKVEEVARLAEAADKFESYNILAAQVRVQLLEKLGYSPYAARRIGLMPDLPVETLTRDLTQNEVISLTIRRMDSYHRELIRKILDKTSVQMQRAPLLVTRLVGLTVANALTGQEAHLYKIEEARSDIFALIQAVEQKAIPFATEPMMVKYYNDVLLLGEETAMKNLLAESEKTRRPQPASR
jgi:hypothetical protein